REEEVRPVTVRRTRPGIDESMSPATIANDLDECSAAGHCALRSRSVKRSARQPQLAEAGLAAPAPVPEDLDRDLLLRGEVGHRLAVDAAAEDGCEHLAG